jgi:hypothetical protein
VVLQGDKLYSELFNELYQFNFDSRRWFPMVVRPPRKQQPSAKQEAAGAEASGSGGEAPAADQQQDSSSGGAAAACGEQQQGQQEPPPGVSLEMNAILHQAMNDKNSVFFKAAVRIQARFRGYTVRKVRG